MHTEKIIKREDGSRVKIRTHPFIDQEVIYKVYVSTCKKGKRTWISAGDSDLYKYRGLTMDERRALEYKSFLKVVTEEEIQAARLEIWEAMKPTCN